RLSRRAGQLAEQRGGGYQQQDERVEVHDPAQVAAPPPRAHIERKRLTEQATLLSERAEHVDGADARGDGLWCRRSRRLVRDRFRHRGEVDGFAVGLLLLELVLRRPFFSAEYLELVI